ncbi:hypothetical protein ACLQ22_10850 [Micromonospora sp. DT178]|uniref:hypothetical protein n=1 Tax=Micromonospora sp. DT178 TaxID=3393436 RepID=UPI003CFAE4F0
MSLKNLRRAAAVGSVLAALTLVAPAPASAGIYTWHYYGTYSSAAECAATGTSVVESGGAEKYRCQGENGNELYLAQNW